LWGCYKNRVGDLKTQIDKINNELKPKQDLLDYAYKRHTVLMKEKNDLAGQLTQLTKMFQSLKGKSDIKSTDDLKEELYEIIKEKNQMEIELEESRMNRGFYKVATFIVVFLRGVYENRHV